jgi:spore coat protein A, manganese oxidase
MSHTMMTRRQMLRAGLLGASSLLLPTRRAAAQSAMFAPFQVPLPIAPVLTPTSSTGKKGGSTGTDFYTITQQPADVQIIPGGPPTRIWGYNGLYPGPTIRAKRGRPVVVRQINNLPDPVVVHLHGAHTPPASDGFPIDFIQPGTYRDYTYPNDDERGATYWYHDHAMDITAHHVYAGLAGFYILEDDAEATLPLPKPPYDIPLVFQDRSFYPDGSLYYDSFDSNGFLGDHFLVNGAITPVLQVSRRKYRFRLLNGSNSRVYVFGLDNGRPLTQIASDGGLLGAPVQRDTIAMAPAERTEVVIDFAAYPVGTRVVLMNYLEQDTGKYADVLNLGPGRPVMAFDVAYNLGRRETDTSSVPGVLRPVQRLSEADATVHRRFEFGRSNGAWVINGQLFDPERVDFRPRLGDIEVWELVNGSGGWVHPVHLHDLQWQILDRNGSPPAAHEAGFKDVFFLGANESVRVIGHFTGENNVGRYQFHCHNVEHEDMRMMSRWDVVR